MPSKIGWTDETWNPIAGCTMVSDGCTNCYAMRQAARLARIGRARPGSPTLALYDQVVTAGGKWNGEVRLVEAALDQPLRWKRPRMVFVCSMSDLFHASVPSEFIFRVFSVMARCPQHTFQVLTKRPDRMAAICGRHDFGLRVARLATGDPIVGPGTAVGWTRCGLPNVWLGTSIESDLHTHRAGKLQCCPAAVQFLSLEPLLGEIRIPITWLTYKGTRQWVIVGGESGPRHRPMRLEWLERIVKDCKSEGVPVFLKQDSGPRPDQQGRISDELWKLKEFPEKTTEKTKINLPLARSRGRL